MAGTGFALGVAAGVGAGLWAVAPSSGPAARALAALLIPAALLGLAGAFGLPAATWAVGGRRPAEPRPPQRPAGLFRRLLLAGGGIAAAGLLALALQRGLTLAFPAMGWRPRLGASFGLWLLVAVLGARLLAGVTSGRLRLAGAAAALAACVALLAAGRTPGSGPVTGPAPGLPVAVGLPRPNLALIVLDTTRADRLSLYGHAQPTSPFLDELAKDATVYDDAISPAPWTLPTHASLFTGQLPSVHDATTEHRYLDDRFVTLAEILQRAGYDTAGFSSNSVAGSIYNLQQGFARFEDVWRLRAKAGDDPLVRILPTAVLRWLETGTTEGDKGAGLVNGLVEGWLEGRASAGDRRPFFFFVNYVEAHLPYSAPEPWRSQFLRGPLTPRLAAVTSADASDVVFQLMGTDQKLTEEELQRIGELYDAGLAYQDFRLRELVGTLAQRGLLDDTLLVIVSDHGENLGDHGGLLSHAFSVHQTLVRVPLVVRLPALFPRGAHIPGPVSTLSIFATLLAAAHVDPDSAWPPAAGPLPLGEADGRRHAVSEYGLPVYELGLLANEARGTDIRRFAVRQRAVQDASHKLVLPSEGPARLYDLAQDPAEDHPLEAGGRDEAERLAHLLGEKLSTSPGAARSSTPGPGGLDAATRDALRALGYVR